jgi:hypothetical protein
MHGAASPCSEHKMRFKKMDRNFAWNCKAVQTMLARFIHSSITKAVPTNFLWTEATLDHALCTVRSIHWKICQLSFGCYVGIASSVWSKNKKLHACTYLRLTSLTVLFSMTCGPTLHVDSFEPDQIRTWLTFLSDTHEPIQWAKWIAFSPHSGWSTEEIALSTNFSREYKVLQGSPLLRYFCSFHYFTSNLLHIYLDFQ